MSPDEREKCYMSTVKQWKFPYLDSFEEIFIGGKAANEKQGIDRLCSPV